MTVSILQLDKLFPMRKNNLTLLPFIPFFFCACTASFYPAAEHTPLPGRKAGCDLIFLTQFPEDKNSYEEIGTCKGTGLKGIFKNEFDNAYKMLEKCACNNGANAIVFIRVNSYLKVDEFRRAEQTRIDYVAHILHLNEEYKPQD